MKKKLVVWLPPNWSSEPNPDGPFAVHSGPAGVGVLQISFAEYSGGRRPDPTPKDLMELASNSGEKLGLAVLQSYSGKCLLGYYGTAVFGRGEGVQSDEAFCNQIWFLSDGLDFVFVTFFASSTPPEQEFHDAQRIVDGIALK
jgi:hypothetical protein